jgi:hypothetical protein
MRPNFSYLTKALSAFERGLAALSLIVGLNWREKSEGWKPIAAFSCVFGLLFLPASILSLSDKNWLQRIFGKLSDPSLHSWISTVTLLVAFFLIVSINRAWSLNERLRGEISREISEENIQVLPDLRWYAALSAGLLIPLFPLLLAFSNNLLHAFSASGASVADWIWFSFESIFRATMFAIFPNANDGGGWAEIKPLNLIGTHIQTFVRFSYDLLLVSAVAEFFRIETVCNEAVIALRSDSRPAAKVGSRIIAKVVFEIGKQSEADETDDFVQPKKIRNTIVLNGVKALRAIGSPKVLRTLCLLINESANSWIIAQAAVTIRELLVQLNSVSSRSNRRRIALAVEAAQSALRRPDLKPMAREALESILTVPGVLFS